MTADGQRGRSPGNSSPVGGLWSLWLVAAGLVGVGTVMCLLYPEHLPAEDLESLNVIAKADGSYLRLKA